MLKNYEVSILVMNIQDQFYQKYEETIQKLVHALWSFRTVFLMNQSTTADATLRTSHKKQTNKQTNKTLPALKWLERSLSNHVSGAFISFLCLMVL